VTRRLVSVELTHRKAFLNGNFAYDHDLYDLLKYRKVGWDYTPSGKAWIHNKAAGITDEHGKIPGWDGYIHLIQHGEMSAGVFLAKKDEIEKTLNVQFKIKDLRSPLPFKAQVESPASDKQVRSYQMECVEAMVQASSTGGLILAATGTGKTKTVGDFFLRLQGSALFLVDELTLLKQAQEELGSILGEPIGMIGNSVFDPKRITVGTVQTVHRHRRDPKYRPWTKSLSVIIIDECHLALNRRNFQTVRAVSPPCTFGLTATLELKKKHIAMQAYELCGPVVYTYPLAQGVEEGYLSRGVAVQVLVDSGKSVVRNGNRRFWFINRMLGRKDYQKEYRELIVENKERNKVIRDLVWESYKRDKYIIILVERVKHLHDLSASFDGIPHLILYGDKPVDERVAGKHLFEQGKVRVILTNKIFKKGVNIKRVDVIIDGAAMKSKNDAVQKYGRGVRLSDQKLGLIYYDLSDRNNRFQKAATFRASAFRHLGIPLYKVEGSIGAEKIVELAQAKLEALVGKK
jgi:superfamily II DNA or RNA helicase